MRLSAEHINIIKDLFYKQFPGSRIYLFGSRTDDTKKGGDIDLLILSKNKYDFITMSGFKNDLIRKIGDRKIDILNYTTSDTSSFLELILSEAIEL